MPSLPPFQQEISQWLREIDSGVVLIVLVWVIGRCAALLIRMAGGCIEDWMWLRTAERLGRLPRRSRIRLVSRSHRLDVSHRTGVRPPAPGPNVVSLQQWKRRDKDRRSRTGSSPPEDDRRKPAG
jgi:hypothetical protein